MSKPLSKTELLRLSPRFAAARCRLDAAVDLLNRALDLRELLWCGIDLDHARDLVAALKRDVQVHGGRGDDPPQVSA